MQLLDLVVVLSQPFALHESPLTALAPFQKVKNKWLVCASWGTVYVDVVV